MNAGEADGGVFVVTGATSGIGLATCEAALAAGARVVAVGRRPHPLAGADRLLALSLDVRHPQDMATMAEQTLAAFGRIDVLVASAGLLRTGPPTTVDKLPVEEWDTVIDTNLRGTFLSNRAVLPAMLAQRSGVIINLSSTSGRKGLAYDAAYCASKFAVIGLSEALADEVGPRGIKVQVVLPGPVDTPVWEQNGSLPPPAAMLSPQRVAEVVLRVATLPGDTVVGPLEVIPVRRRGGRAAAQRSGQPAAVGAAR
jgi:NAD(P)-dependent dehydrogenase (short-subunit alcohol dehydrogenase family)